MSNGYYRRIPSSIGGLGAYIFYRKEEAYLAAFATTKMRSSLKIRTTRRFSPTYAYKTAEWRSNLRATSRLGMFGISTATESGLFGKLRLLKVPLQMPWFNPIEARKNIGKVVLMP